ncbi:hypothetical protein L7F22_063768 [Adiantum nelumboides]|nr:hypothetical protein [Adiantum nelumboides]
MERLQKKQLHVASGFVKDDFYESIQAPKWRDFDLPEEPVDDHEWFCRRAGLLQLTMEKFIKEPAEGAKEQSSGMEQLSGQALGMEKVGEKRPTTAPVEALSDAPEELLSKYHKKRRSTVIVQLNKELMMLKEMNEKNAKQAEDYKDKYYQASKEAKRLTEEASMWYDFQEEIRKLEAERENTVNSLQNNLATALKKQAAYAKRKDCSKKDV